MIFEKQILNIYKGMAFSRCDNNGTAYYFSSDDFSGLEKRRYELKSSLGHTLVGYIYSYPSPIEGRIVVFDHGFGGGHRSYMKEIELLCKHGYRVFAYDHTGCMESGGESANGMTQSLVDLNDVINTIKKDDELGRLDISVVGHSWGGYSCLNITALHPDISHVVVISGFVSVKLLVDSFFGGLLKGYRKAVMALERATSPDFVDYDATKTLAKTSARVLLIYSSNDTLCPQKPHFEALKNALDGKAGVRLMLVQNKGHNPNYTEDAVKCLGAYLKEKKRLSKKKLLATASQREQFVKAQDWNKMTEQDINVWNEIFATLDGGNNG